MVLNWLKTKYREHIFRKKMAQDMRNKYGSTSFRSYCKYIYSGQYKTVLITAFNDILQEGDVTDSEREDIEYRLSEIRKTIAKYPTIDSLKNLYTREAKYFNFKNRNYIINKINEYQPRRMAISTLCDEIRKTYKFPKRVFNLGNTGVTGIVTRASRHHNLPNQNLAYQGYDLPQNPIDQNWTNEFDR